MDLIDWVMLGTFFLGWIACFIVSCSFFRCKSKFLGVLYVIAGMSNLYFCVDLICTAWIMSSY